MVELEIVPDSCVASLFFSCYLDYSVGSRIPAHAAALQKGLQKADLVLTTRGTSMGPTDLLKPIIERHLEGVVHEAVISKPFFDLPGNPVSALVTFYVSIVLALRTMGGWPEKERELPRVMVQMRSSGLTLLY